jgi:phosphotransferase system HPr-like phosphotransfer protein
MEQYNLKFHTVQQICDFVRWGESIDMTMDISTGVLEVDAKSIMGILVIGLNREVVLSVHGQLSQEEITCLAAYRSR